MIVGKGVRKEVDPRPQGKQHNALKMGVVVVVRVARKRTDRKLCVTLGRVLWPGPWLASSLVVEGNPKLERKAPQLSARLSHGGREDSGWGDPVFNGFNNR